MNAYRESPRSRQRGVTLVVGLIMMVVVTLLVVSAMKTSWVNFRIVGNMQFREEAIAAAQTAIEQLISSKGFVDNPNAVTSMAIDHDGISATPAYTVTFNPVPSCTTFEYIIDKSDPGCQISSSAGGSGLVEIVSNAGTVETTLTNKIANVQKTTCAKSNWKVTARVDSGPLGLAKTRVVQGVYLKVGSEQASTYCK